MLDYIYKWLRQEYFPFDTDRGGLLHCARDDKRGVYRVWFYSADSRLCWDIEPHSTITELVDALKGAEVI